MDLSTIDNNLVNGLYQNPTEFAKDMRMIFSNSKSYNTNKRSQIYAMTLRLSTLFESLFRPVMDNWKVARRKKTNSII